MAKKSVDHVMYFQAFLLSLDTLDFSLPLPCFAKIFDYNYFIIVKIAETKVENGVSRVSFIRL